MLKKTGIFGGSFNPPHIGHMYLAEAAYKTFGLDEIIFVPCGISPYKNKVIDTHAEYRLDMLRMMMKYFDFPCSYDKYEIDRKEVSYTIDTLRYMKDKYPDNELYLICGPDAVISIHEWKDSDLISNYAVLALAGKDFECADLNVRSTVIRRLVKENKSISWLVPKLVEEYIGIVDLYKESNG